MFELLVATAESGEIVPDETSSRIVWAAVAAVILGLYLFMRSARRNADKEYWARREAEEERIANDPDMRKD